MRCERTLIYILTLGVIKPYRNLGIASALVGKVTKYAGASSSCRGVYLHVISYNRAAILFYKKASFQCAHRLPAFYAIAGRAYDAYLYVYYVNGGRPPGSTLDVLSTTGSLLRSIFRFWAELWGATLPQRAADDDAKGGARPQWLQCRDACGQLSPRHHQLTYV
eukprot:SM000041S15528  [mRNA]  locus=s41:601170:602444:+ [translate_table: standard]